MGRDLSRTSRTGSRFLWATDGAVTLVVSLWHLQIPLLTVPEEDTRTKKPGLLEVIRLLEEV